MTEPPIVIFTALAWESAAVRAALQQVRREDERVWRGVVGKRTALVVTGGIGPRRTQQMLERFTAMPFAMILSVGCAGALIPGLTTGHLILAPDVCIWSGEAEGKLDRFLVDARLLACAQAAAADARIPTVAGSLFTSTRVLFTAEEKARQGQVTGAVAVEMETGVHAAFATTRGIPFLAVRIILDSVAMTLPVMKGMMTPDGAVRPLKAVSHLVTHPQHLSALLALKRCRATASQALTRLCRSLFPLLEE